jgi:hypothetical protein
MGRVQWVRWIAAACALLAALCARAHEVPTDVRVRMFVKPEGRQLSITMRAPLAAMREVDVPLRGPGYVDLARAS